MAANIEGVLYENAGYAMFIFTLERAPISLLQKLPERIIGQRAPDFSCAVGVIPITIQSSGRREEASAGLRDRILA